MSNLLTIKEAASYLSVSTMSLRRWTNSGKLNCLRIGKKNERRFREEDLKSYLNSTQASSPVTIVLPEQSHVAHFYQNPKEALELGLSFLKDGLDRGELVVGVFTINQCATLKNKLHELGVLADVLEAQQILSVFDGCDSPSEQILFIDRILEKTQDFNGFTLVEDMGWTREKEWSTQMLWKLEKLTNLQRKNLSTKFICQYDLNAFSRNEAFLAMQTHDHTIYNKKLNICSYYELAPKWDPTTTT